MLPVLISLGPFSISSFGLFLALAFLYSTFLIWRLARAWDLDAERVLDLTLLTFFGSLLGSRIYFILQHLDFFGFNLVKMIAVTQYPGFSFWGGFLGGWLTLYFFVRKFRLEFWQMADIAAVGFLGSLILGNVGCLLGGCSIGVQSNLPIAIKMVGAVGKRFPIQALEALSYAGVLYLIWPKAVHFHIPGRICGLVMIYVGLIKFISEFFRAQSMGGHFLSLTLILLGFGILHKICRRTLKEEGQFWLKQIKQLPNLYKSRYNKQI